MSHHDEGKHVTGDYTSAEITEQMLRRKIHRLETEKAELVDKFRNLLQQIDSTPKRIAGYHELYCIQFNADQIDKLRKDVEALARVKEG